MYRILFAVFLSFLVLHQTLNQSGILLTFKLRQEYIAKNLCVQRNKKVNTCNGKCHLKKELKKSAEQESETSKPYPAKTKTKTFDSPFLNNLFSFVFYSFLFKKDSQIELASTFTSDYIADIFIPPDHTDDAIFVA